MKTSIIMICEKLHKIIKKDFYFKSECAIITFVANGSILGHAACPWLSWIERSATNRKVGGSNPSGHAINRSVMPFASFLWMAFFYN